MIDTEIAAWILDASFLCLGVRHHIEDAHAAHLVLERTTPSSAIRGDFTLILRNVVHELDTAVGLVGDTYPGGCNTLHGAVSIFPCLMR